MEQHRYRYLAPRVLTRAVPDAELLRLWRSGLDTYAIASTAGVPEYEVYNRLPRIREIARQNQEWDFDAMVPAQGGA